MSKSGIHIKPENKGKFNATKKKTGKSTEELTHSKNPVTRKRAIFAQNAKKWKHAEGGYLMPSMGMGSWLGGATSGVASGAAAGAALGPWGAAIGGVAGGLMGGLKSNAENKQMEAEKLQLQKQMEQAIGQSRLEGSRQVANIPTFPLGGDVDLINQNLGLGYKMYAWGGTPSWDPNERPMQNSLYDLGGNINELASLRGYSYNLMPNGGNMAELPSWYRSNALSMEVGGMLPTVGSGLPNGATMPRYMAKGGHMPEGTSTLKEAKEFQKLYPKEMAFGTQTEYEHTGNEKLAMRIAADHIKDSIKINQGGEPDYYQKLQMAGISDELNKMPQMKGGGFLSSAKAQEMLKDGKIHGKPLTERQKRYFQAIAHGFKPSYSNGGELKTTWSIID